MIYTGDEEYPDEITSGLDEDAEYDHWRDTRDRFRWEDTAGPNEEKDQ